MPHEEPKKGKQKPLKLTTHAKRVLKEEQLRRREERGGFVGPSDIWLRLSVANVRALEKQEHAKASPKPKKKGTKYQVPK